MLEFYYIYSEPVNTVFGAIWGAPNAPDPSMTAVRMVPIPIVGPYIWGPVSEAAYKLLHKHKNKDQSGFNIAFLPGTSAQAILPRGELSFTVPAPSLQGGNPALMRVKISPKDSARIIRSIHASVTIVKGDLGTRPQMTVLGIDEDAIPCRTELRNGDVALIPNTPLEPGEYAVVLVPAQQDYVPLAGTGVWDFRVM